LSFLRIPGWMMDVLFHECIAYSFPTNNSKIRLSSNPRRNLYIDLIIWRNRESMEKSQHNRKSPFFMLYVILCLILLFVFVWLLSSDDIKFHIVKCSCIFLAESVTEGSAGLSRRRYECIRQEHRRPAVPQRARTAPLGRQVATKTTWLSLRQSDNRYF
jgi:hypothetical protein